MPIELIAVIVGTASSYLANFETVYDVNIIGNVPTGLVLSIRSFDFTEDIEEIPQKEDEKFS